MLDQFFYRIDKGIYEAGADWAVIGVFFIIILIACYCVLALKVNRLLHAGVAVFILMFVTYFPCVSFPQLLEGAYLHLGLITPWYIEAVPNVIRFPTLWLHAILIPVSIWTVFAMMKDLLRGDPLLTKKIIARRHEYALEVDRQLREQWRKEKQERERERMQEDPAGLH
ncbi:hypothetical protein ACFQI7_28030 [Paenibacillus allorhizosphaerae]|uniref:TIGR03546 family protein n=1 Tax=Paenibacillus allorhizosphaerae TaxID=2849866 RepID=A0ABN7TVG0_9BACL|nr:hypothetical protein [Paenibacillus allorhizosphaerae]CAG7651598.1 hypothetical protein PAECIP111802_05005 [Paenibacillus allorhizosphaerae]